MDTVAAIDNLENDDPAVVSECMRVCKLFQTASGFNLSLFEQLVNPDSDFKYQIFGWQSLMIIIKHSFNNLKDVVSNTIKEMFPFYTSVDESSPILPTVYDCTALMIAYILPLDEIISFFDSNFVPIEIVKNFLLQINQNCFLESRKDTIEILHNEYQYEIITRHILNNLVQFSVMTIEFSKYINALGDIIDDVPGIIDVLIKNPENEQLFSTFADSAWIPNVASHVVYVFLAILQSRFEKPNVIRNLFSSLIEELPELYASLFIVEGDVIETIDDIIQAYIIRIPLINQLLLNLSIDDIKSAIRIVSLFLESQSPSVIVETSKCLISFLGNKNITSLPEFAEQLKDERWKIVESCANLISKNFQQLYLTKFDSEWEIVQSKSQIFQLVNVISGAFDAPLIINEVTQMILEKDQNNPAFFGLIKVLNSSIVQMTEEDAEATTESLTNLFKFLVQIEPNGGSKNIESFYTLLGKIIPYIELDPNIIPQLFQSLFDKVINNRMRAFDPLMNFFLRFTRQYLGVVELPFETFENIPPAHPSFWPSRIVLAEASIKSEDNFLGDSINEALIRLQSIPPPDGLEAACFLNGINARLLEFISKIPAHCIDDESASALLESLIIVQNHVTAEANDENFSELQPEETESALTHLTRALHQISTAILHITSLDVELIGPFVEYIEPPTRADHYSVVWAKSLMRPIINLIVAEDAEAAAELAAAAIQIFADIIEDAEPHVWNDAEKLAIEAVRLSDYLDDDAAAEVLEVFGGLESQSVFQAIGDSMEKRSFDFFARTWRILAPKKDESSVCNLTKILLKFIDKDGIDANTIKEMRNINGTQVDALFEKLEGVINPKTKRKHIKAFVEMLNF